MERKETEDIVAELVSALNTTIEVDAITSNLGGTFTITTCNTKYLQVGYRITIDAVERVITNVVHNVSFTVKNGVLPVSTTIQLYPLYYKYGTVITTNNELNKKNDASAILPLIYLRTEFNETLLERDSAMDRESDLEIYFLTQNDFSQTEAQIRKDGILPMRNLAYQFIESLKSNRNIGKFESVQIRNWLRFGFQTDSGTTKKIFNYCDMSGVQINITLPIAKELACCN